MSPPPSQWRSWTEVNLSALERNLKSIRQAIPEHLNFISVIKADAYGHGFRPVVTRLMRANTRAFAVANLEEAADVSEIGSGWPVIVLSSLLPAEYNNAVEMGVCPVVSTLEECRGLNHAAHKQNRRVSIHLKIDTGMGRLGIWHEQAPELITYIRSLDHLELAGICTHFSSADSDPEFTATQRQRFISACRNSLTPEELSRILVHADNSAGIETFPRDGIFNAARIGLMQFGVRTHPHSLLGSLAVEPVISWFTRIGCVKSLPRGCPISYGQTHRLHRDSKIAVLTVGYGDGYPTSLSNQGHVIIRDQICPILGKVTMDQTIVDITHLPEQPQPGDKAILMGTSQDCSISATSLADLSERIEWEVFTAITPRVTRVYRTDSAI